MIAPDLVHHAVSANRVSLALARNSSRTSGVSADGGDSLSSLCAAGLAHWISAIIAGVVVVIGLTLATAGIRNFTRAATPVPTTQPTCALVTTGIHVYTRNPIYLGLFLVYTGIGLVVRSPWILILMLPLALMIRYGVVAREEAYLERRFGDAYEAYKTRVRRWL